MAISFLDDGELMTGAGMAGLTYFASNEDDPYITMKNIVSIIQLILLNNCVCGIVWMRF